MDEDPLLRYEAYYLLCCAGATKLIVFLLYAITLPLLSLNC